MSTAFVFHPDPSYERVQRIREAKVMPAPGLRYVAPATGPWKIFEVLEADALDDLAKRLESLAGSDGGVSGDPPNAFVVGSQKVRRSEYRTQPLWSGSTLGPTIPGSCCRRSLMRSDLMRPTS
jgi:hypothetical protein